MLLRTLLELFFSLCCLFIDLSTCHHPQTADCTQAFRLCGAGHCRLWAAVTSALVHWVAADAPVFTLRTNLLAALLIDLFLVISLLWELSHYCSIFNSILTALKLLLLYCNPYFVCIINPNFFIIFTQHSLATARPKLTPNMYLRVGHFLPNLNTQNCFLWDHC